MANWVEVILSGFIGLLLLEARLRFGTRIAVMENDLKWIVASLAKWGLVAPKTEDKT